MKLTLKSEMEHQDHIDILINITQQKSFKMPSRLSREERRAWAKSNKFGTEHRIPLSDRISLTKSEVRDQGLVCLQAYATTDVDSIDIDSFIDIVEDDIAYHDVGEFTQEQYDFIINRLNNDVED